MSDFLLIPGAGGTAWYWTRVVDELARRGHRGVAVELPGDDPNEGLLEYAGRVVLAGSGLSSITLVAQSMGGFTAPLAWPHIDVARVVFVNAMIPLPGERPGEWWGNVDSAGAMREAAIAHGYSQEFDLDTYFLHDVSPELAAEGEPYQRNEDDRAFDDVCSFEWPDVPIHAVAGRDDRFFPVEFQQRLARERLNVEAAVLPGGHLMALSQPVALTEHLAALTTED